MARSPGSWTVPVLITVLLAGAALMGVLLVRATAPARSTGTPSGPRAVTPGQLALTGPAPTSAIQALATAQPLLGEGRWDEALAVLTPAAEAFPTDQELWLAISSAHQGAERWARSLEALDEAIRLGPAGAAMHIQAGTLANRLGQLDAAVAHYTQAQKLEPAQARHPLFLAMIQIKQGRDDAALASLARATVLDNDLAEAWGTMAELELRRNNLAMALQHVEKARASQPSVVRWRAVQARVHRRAGEPLKAIELLEGLPIEQRTTEPALTELADALGLARRPADAARLYLDAAQAATSDRALLGQHLLSAARWQARAGDVARARQIAAEAAAAGNQQALDFLAELN
jgi:tetratricopeptide (TPR) repeat protein